MVVSNWRTSSRSNGGNGSCVEVGSWRTSSRSSGGNGTCVEVGVGTGSCLCIAVRDSKDRESGQLSFSDSDWGMFVRAVS